MNNRRYFLETKLQGLIKTSQQTAGQSQEVHSKATPPISLRLLS